MLNQHGLDCSIITQVFRLRMIVSTIPGALPQAIINQAFSLVQMVCLSLMRMQQAAAHQINYGSELLLLTSQFPLDILVQVNLKRRIF